MDEKDERNTGCQWNFYMNEIEEAMKKLENNNDIAQIIANQTLYHGIATKEWHLPFNESHKDVLKRGDYGNMDIKWRKEFHSECVRWSLPCQITSLTSDETVAQRFAQNTNCILEIEFQEFHQGLNAYLIDVSWIAKFDEKEWLYFHNSRQWFNNFIFPEFDNLTVKEDNCAKCYCNYNMNRGDATDQIVLYLENLTNCFNNENENVISWFQWFAETELELSKNDFTWQKFHETMIDALRNRKLYNLDSGISALQIWLDYSFRNNVKLSENQSMFFIFFNEFNFVFFISFFFSFFF